MKKFFSAVLAVLIGYTAFAQVTTSSINGRISDTQGEALPGAVVIATNTQTGAQYYAIANDAGQFNVNSMRAGGPYVVEVSFTGMNTVRYEDVVLKLGEAFEINPKLESGNELEAVVVVAQSEFNASKTGAGASFSLRQLETTPSISRSVFDIAKYTPQANASKQGGLSIGGASSRYNSFQIDGAVANDSFGLSSDGTNGSMVGAEPISLDAIEEIQVVVAPFDVRQNGFTGGGINAITKSGTNTVKGSFYARYYNQDFIGTTPYTTDMNDPLHLTSLKDEDKDGVGTRTKYETQVNQTYGFTVGAPIVKNKLFMFLSGEYHQSSVPNIYSPLNNSYELSNLKLKSPVETPDGVSHEYFDTAVAQYAIDHYLQYYSDNGKDMNGKAVNEGFAIQNSDKKSLNILARVDWNISDNHKLMVRYQLLDASSSNRGQGAKTYYFNNSNNTMVNRTHTIVGELNSRLSNTVSNDLLATAVLVNEHREVPYALPTVYTNGDNTIMDIGTHYCSYINKCLTDTYTLTDNLNISAGTHNITLGTHNEFYSFANAYRTYATGQFEFGEMAKFFQQVPGKITASTFKYNYADPTVEGVTGPDWFATSYALQLGFYAQDEWRMSDNLTLTYGLRADVPMLLNKPTENPDYNAFAGQYSTDASEQVGIVPDAAVLLSPRFGFRFFPTDDHKLLIRGGAGIFTGRVPFVWLSNAYNNTGVETKSVNISDKNMLAQLPITTDPYNDIVLGNNFVWYSKDGKSVPAADALNSDGSIKEGYIANRGVDGSSAGATINTLSKNFKYPQVFRANVAADYEFDNGWKVSAEALFSKTFNNIHFRNIALESTVGFNAVSKSATALNPVAQAPLYAPKTSSYKTIVSLGNTNLGYAYSASIKAEKHFDFGLDVMAAYTFGHSYSCNDGLSSQAASNLSTLKAVDINNPELSYSLYDSPHKLNAILTYTSPSYGPRSMFRTSVSLAYTGNSGQRYSYTYKDTSDTDINGDNIAGNTLIYIPTEDEVLMMKWSNPADAFKLENEISSDNYLRTHRGQWSERNGGIGKFENHFDLQITEDIFYDKANKRKVQLTLDVLNVSNLLNRNWGLYYASSINRSILTVDAKPSASNDYTPTYSFNTDNIIYLNDFNSRWRCQLGVRFTF